VPGIVTNAGQVSHTMKHALLSLSACLLLGTVATAQCLDVSSPGTLIGNGDDTQFPTHYPLGFAFPISGAAAPTYTHVRVCCNGWVCLTDGVNSPNFPTALTPTTADLTSVAGSAPRVMAFWRDLNLTAANNGNVYIDSSSNPGVSCKISWVNFVEFGQTAVKSMQMELFVTGEVQFTYSTPMNVQATTAPFVGITPANGIAAPPVSDLSTTNVTTSNCVYQSFAQGTFDLPGRALRFTPIGPGWVWNTICSPAYNAAYGTGCYGSEARSAFYQHFGSAALASATLQGNALLLSPAGTGYAVQWLPAGAALYVPPTGAATSLPTTDDGTITITPSIPLSAPGGAATQLNIAHNGIITLGATANQGTDYTPTPAEFLASTGAAFYSWYDYNDTEAGSGTIKTEEANGFLYVTWDGVEGYNVPAVADPHRFQFQFELATGAVFFVWDTVSPIGYAGREYLVGYNSAGPSVDGGSIDLATVPGFVTGPDLVLSPLTLSASPAPVNDGVNGTLVTFTVTNIPAYLQSSPQTSPYYSALYLSTGSSPGVDLGFVGAPGCRVYLFALQASVPVGPSTGPTQTVALQFPPGSLVPPGSDIWVQAVSAIDVNAGLLPNGQNPLGIVTSNGLQCHVEAQ